MDRKLRETTKLYWCLGLLEKVLALSQPLATEQTNYLHCNSWLKLTTQRLNVSCTIQVSTCTKRL